MTTKQTNDRSFPPRLKTAARYAGGAVLLLVKNEELLALLITTAIIFFFPHAASAQTGSTPIQIWDRSDTDLQRGVLNIVRLVKWLMVAGGVIAICWGVSRMWTRKPFVIELVGGALSLGVGIIIAFSDSLFKTDIQTPDFLGR